MKKILSSAICLTVLLGLVSCGSEAKEPKVRNKPGETVETVESTETKSIDIPSECVLDTDRPVFYLRSSNYAWVTYDRGIFINGDGMIYQFDSSHFQFSAEKKFTMEENFDLFMKYTEPIGSIDTDLLNKLYSLAKSIGPDNELISESVACDMGQISWYYIDPDTGVETMIGSHGDNEETPTDENAQKLWELLDDYYGMTINEYESTSILPEPIMCTRCGPINELPAGENDFILMSKEEMNHFALEFNIEISDITERFNEGNVCYVKILNLTDKIDSLNIDGFMASGNKRDFLIDNDLPVSGEDICDGYILIALYGEYNTEQWVDLKGNKWIPFDFGTDFNKMNDLYNEMAFELFNWETSQTYYQDHENVLMAPGGIHKDVYSMLDVVDDDFRNTWYQYYDQVGSCTGDDQYLMSNIVLYNSASGEPTDTFRKAFSEYRQFDYQTVSQNSISDLISENTGVKTGNELYDIDPDYNIGFINAATIRAEWETPFSSFSIRVFNNDPNTWNEQFFFNSTENIYLECSKGIGFAKPFKGGKYSFIALMPTYEYEFYNANEFGSVFTAQDMQYMWNNRQQREFNVSIPEFEVTDMRNCTFALRNRLSHEYTLMFGESNCLTGVYDDLKVRADAMTSVAGFSLTADGAGINQTEPEEVKGEFACDMCFDRGFIYMVIENDTGLPVLLGTYNGEG